MAWRSKANITEKPILNTLSQTVETHSMTMNQLSLNTSSPNLLVSGEHNHSSNSRKTSNAKNGQSLALNKVNLKSILRSALLLTAFGPARVLGVQNTMNEPPRNTPEDKDWRLYQVKFTPIIGNPSGDVEIVYYGTKNEGAVKIEDGLSEQECKNLLDFHSGAADMKARMDSFPKHKWIDAHFDITEAIPADKFKCFNPTTKQVYEFHPHV